MAWQRAVQLPAAVAEARLGLWERVVLAAPRLPVGLRRLVPVGSGVVGIPTVPTVRSLRLGPLAPVLGPAVLT